jgi:hypothetical protein
MLQQKRLDALWRLAGDVSLDDRSFVRNLLGLGAALLVPGQPFGASYGRVLGTRIAIEAVNDERLTERRADVSTIVRVDEWHAHAIRRLVASRWDDTGSGALLVVPFNAGHALYVLSFASPEPASRPLSTDDEAFAEDIAVLIAGRVQLRWDAVNTRDPLEVVSLTGTLAL